PALGLRAGRDVSLVDADGRRDAMCKRNWKFVLAGALVACLVGGIGLRLAGATPGQGVTVSTIAGPVELDELNINVESDTHGLRIKTRGEWDARVVHHTIAPGGHTGWD